ncbi:MAG: tRNA uridine-5-carboxymethylaminomethyl(34) synthesis GTPase MnmE [Candidatus Omnitrophota bacterium]
MTNLNDTIAAISTPVGQGGIGIVRLSGGNALRIADAVFVSKDKQRPSGFKTYTVHYGWVIDRKLKIENRRAKRAFIDEAILTVMRAPRSYTREDVVEINCHSGIVPLKKTLELVLRRGARLAEPGEFTRRAFLNGRIDLIQAEAVRDIVQSKSEAALRVGLNQLQGRLSKNILSARERLFEAYAHLEAAIDFPDEDIEVSGRNKLKKDIETAAGDIAQLLSGSRRGKILREGILVAICGRPNAGKSSLLNCLLKEERAIVTHIPGTTKDTIEETINIDGIPVRLVDTAGITEPKDLIEEEAIKRSNQAIEAADIILYLIDASVGISKADRKILGRLDDKKLIIVVNKIDLKPRINSATLKRLCQGRLLKRVSALKAIGIRQLEEALAKEIWGGGFKPREDLLISNIRHIELLKTAREAAAGALSALNDGLSAEFIGCELKAALDALDRITGKAFAAELLDKIFADFCIGK